MDICSGLHPGEYIQIIIHLPYISIYFLQQIMCKVVTMLSKDTVEHLLLPRFCDLCSDARLFQVRKVRTASAIFISSKRNC